MSLFEKSNYIDIKWFINVLLIAFFCSPSCGCKKIMTLASHGIAMTMMIDIEILKRHLMSV